MNETLSTLRKQFDDVRVYHNYGWADKERTIKKQPPYFSVAVIHEGSARFVGIAACDERDSFNRSLGRTIALNRALRMAKGIFNPAKAPVSKAEKQRRLEGRGLTTAGIWDGHRFAASVQTKWLNYIPVGLFAPKEKKRRVNVKCKGACQCDNC